MKLLVHLALAVAFPAVSFAQTSNGYVGIYSDSLGNTPCATVPPLSGTTLYVIANTSGGPANGITGAEFRIEVTNPTGWVFSYTPPVAANVAMGNPIDTDPNPNAGGGLNLGFPSCQVPSGSGSIRLGTLAVFNLSGGPTQLLVKRHSQPSNLGFPCALFVRCDQYFSLLCMTSAPPDSCTLGTQKGRAIASDDPAVFTSALNDGGGETEGPPPSDPDREVLAFLAPGIVELPQGQTHAALASTTIHSPAVASVLESHGVESISKTFPNFRPRDRVGVARTGEVVWLQDRSQIYTILLPVGGDQMLLADDLAALVDEVGYAEPNGRFEYQACVNDPDFSSQWYLENTGVPTPLQPTCTAGADIKFCPAYTITAGNPSIKVAIFDSGVDLTHPDLYAVVGDTDLEGHGTMVAGIVRATVNNNGGIAGVAGVTSLISKRRPYDHGAAADSMRALVNWAGVQILNCSWSFNFVSNVMRGGFRDVYMANATAVAAAGDLYPASYPTVIAVGTTDCNDEFAPTNQLPGPHVDVAAPGQDIWTTSLPLEGGARYRYDSGTSLAAPQVSGLAALLIAVASTVNNDDLYNDDIEQLIRLSADDVNFDIAPGEDDYLGTGRINAHRALQLLQPPHELFQDVAAGGTAVDSTTLYQLWFHAPPDTLYTAGNYRVRRFKVQRDVTFPVTFDSIPDVWGRGVATIGYSVETAPGPQAGNWNTGWCEPVPGTITPSGCTLRTFVYHVRGNDSPFPVIGWWPARYDSVEFGYSVFGTSTSTEVLDDPAAIASLVPRLWSANPVRRGATIGFASPRSGAVRIVLFDVAGRRVRVLHDAQVNKGRHELQWNGLADKGGSLPSGLYFVRLETPAGVATRKLVVLE